MGEQNLYKRLASATSDKGEAAALTETIDTQWHAIAPLLVTLLGDGEITLAGHSRNVHTIVGIANRSQEVRHLLIPMIPRLIETTLCDLKHQLAECERALDVSPFRDEGAAKALRSRLGDNGLKARTNEVVEMLSSLAGVDEINVTKLEGAARAAEILRYSIESHGAIVREEASALARAFVQPLTGNHSIAVANVGTLGVEEFHGWRVRGLLQRTTQVGSFIPFAPCLPWLAMFALMNIEHPFMTARRNLGRGKPVKLGSALTVDGRALGQPDRVTPKLQRRVSQPAVATSDAARFLIHWDDAVSAVEKHMADIRNHRQQLVATAATLV